MSRSQPNIGRAELEILHYITEHHPVTVREVADHVAETKGHVRTTVLNIMERLRKKGYLTRKKADGIFQYSPRVPKTELLRNLVRDFVAKALGGSLFILTKLVVTMTETTDVVKRLFFSGVSGCGRWFGHGLNRPMTILRPFYSMPQKTG